MVYRHWQKPEEYIDVKQTLPVHTTLPLGSTNASAPDAKWYFPDFFIQTPSISFLKGAFKIRASLHVILKISFTLLSVKKKIAARPVPGKLAGS